MKIDVLILKGLLQMTSVSFLKYMTSRTVMTMLSTHMSGGFLLSIEHP